MATGNQTNNRQQKRSKSLTQQQKRSLLSRQVGAWLVTASGGRTDANVGDLQTSQLKKCNEDHFLYIQLRRRNIKLRLAKPREALKLQLELVR